MCVVYTVRSCCCWLTLYCSGWCAGVVGGLAIDSVDERQQQAGPHILLLARLITAYACSITILFKLPQNLMIGFRFCDTNHNTSFAMASSSSSSSAVKALDLSAVDGFQQQEGGQKHSQGKKKQQGGKKPGAGSGSGSARRRGKKRGREAGSVDKKKVVKYSRGRGIGYKVGEQHLRHTPTTALSYTYIVRWCLLGGPHRTFVTRNFAVVSTTPRSNSGWLLSLLPELSCCCLPKQGKLAPLNQPAPQCPNTHTTLVLPDTWRLRALSEPTSSSRRRSRMLSTLGWLARRCS